MKIIRTSAVAVMASSGVAVAFNTNTQRIVEDVSRSRIRIGKSKAQHAVHVQSPSAFTDYLSSRSESRRCAGLRMSPSSYDDSEGPSHSHTPCGGDREIVDTSRRAALRRCSSIFTATAFASVFNKREANAAGFSDSIDEVYAQVDQAPPPVPKTGPPQFSDQRVITPPQVVQSQEQQQQQQQQLATPEPVSAAPGSSSVSETTLAYPPQQAQAVTLENSQAQVVTTPTKQVPVASSSPPIQVKEGPAPTKATKPKITPNISSDEYGATTVEPVRQDTPMMGVGLEVGTIVGSLGAIVYAVAGRVQPNTDSLSAKCKVVMIENEPYGVGTGRRWYNGVDVTINDPIPASDIREMCNAGKVNNECTKTITGFLGEVSNSNSGMEPSAGQQETATAVLSYLDSMSSSLGQSHWDANGDYNSETYMAFSSYLNELSTGTIAAPSSPQLVADYLDALNGEGTERLNKVENRIDALETSVDQLPDRISGRMQQWQAEQNQRLTTEFSKIENYLVNDAGINGGGVNGDVNGSGINGGGVNGDVNGSGINGGAISAEPMVNGMNGSSGMPFM